MNQSISISLVSGKGGVGKTSIAVNLALLAARQGIRTLLVDCDVYTLGATVFITTGICKNYYKDSKILTFKDILEGKVTTETIETCGKTPFTLPENLDFIPAKWHEEEADKFIGLKRWDKKCEDLLYLLMTERWNNDYELVVYDMNAGFYELQYLIIKNTNKIMLVREKNTLSMNTSKEVFEKIMRQFAGKTFFDCINKYAPNEPWPAMTNSFSTQCLGFSNTNELSMKINEGNRVEIDLSDACAQLCMLAKTTLPEFNKNWESLDAEIVELENKKKSEDEAAEEEKDRNYILDSINDKRNERISFFTFGSLVIFLLGLFINLYRYFYKREYILFFQQVKWLIVFEIILFVITFIFFEIKYYKLSSYRYYREIRNKKLDKVKSFIKSIKL